MPRYKDHKLREHFDTMLSFARDHGPELFTSDGNQRRGAGHRAAFWNGYNDQTNRKYPRGTFSYAAFHAGRQFAKECQTKATRENSHD